MTQSRAVQGIVNDSEVDRVLAKDFLFRKDVLPLGRDNHVQRNGYYCGVI